MYKRSMYILNKKNISNFNLIFIKIMYVYTIIGAVIMGIGIIFFNEQIAEVFGFNKQNPFFFGISGSLYLSLAVTSILGLINPVRYIPILIMQLVYKIIWFAFVFIPNGIANGFKMYAIYIAIAYSTYIIGDLIAIPFKYIFSNKTKTDNNS